MSPRKALYPLVAAVGIGALGYYAYHAQRQPNQPAPAIETARAPAAAQAGGRQGGAGPVAVDVADVRKMSLVDEVHAVGSLRSNESVVIRPEVSGRITRLNFKDGQRVERGQLLVGFDATVNQAEVRQAEAELNIAKANYNRNADLAKQKFISDRARDESMANVQVLEARLALAQARLSKMEIRAPFSGTVGIRNVSVGDFVKDGADLINLEDISSVKVDFRVPERYVDAARPGQLIEVMVDALPGQVFRARVDAVDPQIDSTGRSALLRGRINNPEGRLKPGMFARVRLILAERAQALVVPEEAIVPQGGEFSVWKVVDGKAVRTPVRTGLRRDAQVEVVEGLTEGDVVVTAGQIRLSRDGTPVRIAGAPPASNAAPIAQPAKPPSRG
ncbi:MAG TPA: efflux RND transporter periplasmic adaptor subunit [Noviherbaspirillum sp.]|nr:efflux RND transporter periplasmic adaptor subunit [Noviherbaspirillum sp.]